MDAMDSVERWPCRAVLSGAGAAWFSSGNTCTQRCRSPSQQQQPRRVRLHQPGGPKGPVV